MNKIVGFLIGAWMPYLFGWWGDIEFPISVTLVITALWVTGSLKTGK